MARIPQHKSLSPLGSAYSVEGDALQQPLQLRCGAVLHNRLAKAAMTERLAGSDHAPGPRHWRLYTRFAEGSPGLLISGNIMVDRLHLESAGNVALTDERHRTAFQLWTAAARSGGSHFWAQISHPGRQTSRFINAHPVSASDVGLSDRLLYARPRPLSAEEIEAIIADFVRTAVLAREFGFTGIQIHAAHGYLLSQFLSPLTNRRTDEWGGVLENRARLLMEIVYRVRAAVGSDFPISVKINSADFQRGGFEEDDSLKVIQMLERAGIDLLEISGGNYESPSMFDKGPVRESTRRREAYFLDFATRVRKTTRLALMITGGFRSREFVNKTLNSGKVDVIGMARPFLLEHDFARRFLRNALAEVPQPALKTGWKTTDLMAEGGWYDLQIRRLSRGLNPARSISAWRGVMHILNFEFVKSIAHILRGRR